MAGVSIATNPSDGTKLAYDVSGEGPGVLLLHGSALSRAIWRGLGYMRALEGFTVVRMDLRGHGRSGKPHTPDRYRMPLVVEDVTAVLDDARVGPCHVVGYSFGARVGFALAAPDAWRVATLATLGGTYRSQRGEVEKVFFPGYLEALRTGGMTAFHARAAHGGNPRSAATRAVP